MVQSIIIFDNTNSGRNEEDAVIKKVNRLLVVVVIAAASVIEVDCTQSENGNFRTDGSERSMESTVGKDGISTTNKSNTVSTGGEEGIK